MKKNVLITGLAVLILVFWMKAEVKAQYAVPSMLRVESTENVDLAYVKADSLTGLGMSSVTIWMRIHGMTGPGFPGIFYGLSPNYNSGNQEPSVLTILQPVNDTIIGYVLTGLSPNTQYSYRAEVLPGVATGMDTIRTFKTFSCNYTMNITPVADTICTGGSVFLTVTVSGGTSPTYVWSSGLGSSSSVNVSPTSTTNYYVTVTDGGCISSASSKVVVMTTPTATATATATTICSGTSIVLHASGGTNYAWSPSTGLSAINIANPVANPTSTTNYYVTVTNATCVAVESVKVTVAAAMNFNLSGNVTICATTHTTIVASATGNVSYLWNTGQTSSSITVNPVNSTVYNVTASNGTCTETGSVTITVESLPIIQSVTNGNVLTIRGIGLSDVNQIEVQPEASTYYPYFINGDTVAKFSGVMLHSGDDIVIQTQFGCKSDFGYSTAGIFEKDKDATIKVYPNPFTDALKVELPEGKYKVSLTNTTGQEVRAFSTEGTFTIQRENLISCTYFLRITSADTTRTFKIQVE